MGYAGTVPAKNTVTSPPSGERKNTEPMFSPARLVWVLKFMTSTPKKFGTPSVLVKAISVGLKALKAKLVRPRVPAKLNSVSKFGSRLMSTLDERAMPV